MLRRLRRPGYWIVLLAILAVYFYRQYLHQEELQRLEAKKRLYQSYGERFLGQLGEGNFTGCQSCFDREGNASIALEDIALFVETLHLDRPHTLRWKNLNENNDTVTLSGELTLDGNGSYPIDIMVVRRGKKILMRKVHVGPKTLQLHHEGFPFTTSQENNVTK
ncbi:hypothetical protein [Nitratifractor salsuginis]|uniref:Uncharacterized protein n=1 Tax=Nitratifractor salsuginis (strain DSM 16511 / JCM 12458 / E9I37-1) TaxID=749222 RepID=E6X279_NITSE|nr:hypothetical protein [Nitratifractor salsuginis]ADV46014.1 hypothetical protein Nitsa_0747 [Nitratifractor salsuginis DSM 16511]